MAEDKIGKIEKREITAELRESYLDYAMSVIVGRALPDVRDGLKPVHRRILWAMWEMGLTSQAKYRKSANVVGSVLGSYHPHSDTAVYDSLARMAQDFSLRYPLIDGQGNWGDIDGDPPAAMRYTECRLTSIASALLVDIEKDTVDFIPNYDDTKKEPTVLPAKLPNLLINGSDGIAVGMATKIPPHNIGEVIDAITHVIDHPKATAADLMEFIKGPDFPTGGVIYDKKSIEEAYISGRGGITARGTVDIEDKRIVITEIPYQVNKSDLIIKMAELVQTKRVVGIREIRDESDRDGLRITIDLKNDAVPQKTMNQLWRFTDLQKDYHLNMVALTESGLQPQTMSIKDVVAGFIEHRKEVVVRRTKFELKRAKDRAHILEGLAKALSVIDKVIAVIKKSKNREDAHKNLVKTFKFSPRQADAILEMRLQSLAALERKKIEDELKEKEKIIKELTTLLADSKRILSLIKEEISELKEKFGDERRTKLHVGKLKELGIEDMVPQEDAVITMSGDGYIKRIAPSTFKKQHRGGKGLKGSTLRDEDVLAHFIGTNTHDNILFFTDSGRVFQTKVYEIPVGSRTGKGKAIHNFLEIPNNAKISAIVTYKDNVKEDTSLVMATKNGIVKKTSLDKFKNVRKSGIIAINLGKEDSLKWVKLSNKGSEIILNTRQGRAIRFKESDIRSMGRTAGGVKGITLRKGDEVSSFDVLNPKEEMHLLVIMANGYAKQTPLKEYKVQHRGGSGILTAKITEKTGALVSSHAIINETELLAISARGQILRTAIKSIRKAGRATQGVRIMRLEKGDELVGTVCL